MVIQFLRRGFRGTSDFVAVTAVVAAVVGGVRGSWREWVFYCFHIKGMLGCRRCQCLLCCRCAIIATLPTKGEGEYCTYSCSGGHKVWLQTSGVMAVNSDEPSCGGTLFVWERGGGRVGRGGEGRMDNFRAGTLRDLHNGGGEKPMKDVILGECRGRREHSRAEAPNETFTRKGRIK